MSLYNMINGFHFHTPLVLGMLKMDPRDDIPRFRDAFIGRVTKDENDPLRNVTDNDPTILTVYTRTGGWNRGEYEEENQKLKDHPLYLSDRDDSFDDTYAFWEFKVPDEVQEPLKRFIEAAKADEDFPLEAAKQLLEFLETEDHDE